MEVAKRRGNQHKKKSRDRKKKWWPRLAVIGIVIFIPFYVVVLVSP
jgi:hypothetical protein